ncbi:ABC transporter permease (plasmid) [Qingshengfaniella alkalisoli]|uniref:ABC transporter permease n=2 Tax=Qingshengfaniella alkalisoli TaxID=2599296 RepID=A0A5B8J1L5_9RHOB|nr:ABC transporter permease [Qingshengfaniella alkalisoli]
MREFALIVIILALCIGMSFASPYFLTEGNMRAVLLSFSTEGIVVVGMTILLISGGIDLSVGSVMALTMAVAGKLFLMGVDPWLASIIGIASASMIGVIMSFFVTRVGLHYFIVSLAFLGIARGMTLVVTQGTPLSLFSLPPSFKFIGQGSIYGIPFVVILFFAIVIIADFLLRRATMFRRVYYTGSNEKAAEYSGIRTNRVKAGAIILCSTLTGLAGVIFMSKFGAATPQFGVGMELNVIAAAVIGGASLTGGSGSVLGAILGIALLSLVTSSLQLLDVPVFWQDAIKGGILLAAVTVDHLVHTRKR